VGVGLDAYGTYWWRDRPIQAPQQLGGDHYSDSAHSVPLQHLAQGGLLLALAYAAVVVVTAIALVHGLRRLRGQERLLLGGLGGAWVAYQVQSLVSIDQVPLLTVHLVLAAGVIVAAGHSPTREFRLPGAPAPVAEQPTRAGRRRPVSPPKPRALTGLDQGLLAGLAVVALLAVWFSLVPLRASRAAYAGDAALAQGDGTAAVAAYDRAIDLLPGWGPYRSKKAQAFNAGGHPALALEGFRDNIRVDPYDIGATRTAARLAESQGDLPLAERLNRRALELDPLNSATILDNAVFDLKHGKAERARDLLEREAPRFPAVAALWASLGDARAVLGETASARQAYERALALQADEPTAVSGLTKLRNAGA
jgi:tetratricopeptide (TPR) repeat protein